MTRYVNALLVFLMVLSAAAVYDMKYEAEIAAERLAEMQRRIEAEKAEISLLKAEWSLLTQPARLADLVDRHRDVLQLQPLGPDQIGSLADIPAKPVPVEPEVLGPTAPLELPADRSAQAGQLSPTDPALVR